MKLAAMRSQTRFGRWRVKPRVPDRQGGVGLQQGMRSRRLISTLLVVGCVLWVVASSGFEAQASLATIVQLGTTIAIYAIAGSGFGLHYGFSGLLSFGFASFLGAGAYATILLIPHRAGLSTELSNGWLPLPAALVLGMLVAALTGVVFGIPAIRLESHFLAVAMFSASIIAWLILRTWDGPTGGVYGIVLYSQPFYDARPGLVDRVASALGLDGPGFWMFLVSASALILVVMFVHVLTRSPWGTILRAVRDDEPAAAALGTNTNLYKLQSLALGAAMGGLSGTLLAFQLGQLNPEMFHPDIVFYVFALVILGGANSTVGPVLGSVVFWTILTQTGNFASENLGGGFVGAALRFILVGLLICVVVVFRPQGILGTRESIRR